MGKDFDAGTPLKELCDDGGESGGSSAKGNVNWIGGRDELKLQSTGS